MSKFSSKEEIIASITKQLNLLENGNSTINDLELLVENTRELYERVLIIKHKAYEQKVYANQNTPDSIDSEEKKDNLVEVESEIVTEIESESDEKIISIGDIFSANDDLFVSEEKPFDFDVFEQNPSITETIEGENEIKVENESSLNSELESNENLANESLDTELEEPFAVDKENEEAVEQEIVVESIEHEFFKSDEQESATPELHKNLNDSEKEEEKSPVENEIQNSERTIGNSIFDKILKQDDSLASRLMLTKLDTLIGAFGFNEKFQCIQELFKNSSEDFNQAIMILDNLQNFDEAKNQLEYYVHLYGWNLESEIVAEFVRKIERRFK